MCQLIAYNKTTIYHIADSSCSIVQYTSIVAVCLKCTAYHHHHHQRRRRWDKEGREETGSEWRRNGI